MDRDAPIDVTKSESKSQSGIRCGRRFQIRRLRVLLCIAIALGEVFIVSSATANAMPSASEPAPMNVLFILADDLGYSDTTLYGTTWFYETPNIQELASRGMTFTNAYSASPLCSAARASILTGQDPARRGFTAAGGHLAREVTRARNSSAEEHALRPGFKSRKAATPVSATRIPRDVDTLAKALKRHGYATGHFGKWHLGPAPHSALDHGFDVDVPNWSGASTSYFAPWSMPELENFKPLKPGEHIEDRMTSEAIAFMEQHRDEPFLLNYWAYSVHAPFEAKPELTQKHAKRAHRAAAQRSPVYAAMIENFDVTVGRLLGAVDRLGLRDKTIIIFSSDNGGSTYDQIDGHPVTSNAPLRGGKAQIYEGGFRVPTVVVWPGRVEAKSRSHALLGSTDWFPTLLDMLGLDPSSSHVFDGVSQVPALQGRAAPRSSFFGFLPHYFPLPQTIPATFLRDGDWKLIRFHHDGPEQQDRFELYDLATDPGEQKDLAGDHPDRVRAMDARISEYLLRIGALVPRKNLDYVPAPNAQGSPATKNPS